MTREPEQSANFQTQYQADSKDVFQAIVRDELAKGTDAGEQAHIYAELGKPDFVLAYLLASALAESEKRAVLAQAYERRAENTEAKAHEFDRKFHRPFPMLDAEAERDRIQARRIRAGHAILPETDRQVPIL